MNKYPQSDGERCLAWPLQVSDIISHFVPSDVLVALPFRFERSTHCLENNARNDDRIYFAPPVFTQLHLLPLLRLFVCLLNIGTFFDCWTTLED